jgi:UDP-glucuronate decarboxylase
MIAMMKTADGITGPVNMGNPEEFTILELAEQLIHMTHSPSKVVFKPQHQDDPVQRRPDISLAGKILNWQPKVPLEEGLAKTIAYFRALL